MWCVPQLDQEYLQRMEAVLEVLNRPLDKRAPVVALDERPVQLLDSLRPATAMVPGQPARATTSTRAAARPMCSAWSSPKPVAIRPTPQKIVPRPNSRERSNGSRRVTPRRTPFIWCWIISTRIGKSRSPPPSVRKWDSECGGDSRCTTPPNTGAGLIRPNWKPACGRDNAWGGSGWRRLPSCASAPAPGTDGPIAPNSKSIGVSPPLMLVACFTTNESLPMSRSTRSSDRALVPCGLRGSGNSHRLDVCDRGQPSAADRSVLSRHREAYPC